LARQSSRTFALEAKEGLSVKLQNEKEAITVVTDSMKFESTEEWHRRGAHDKLKFELGRVRVTTD